MDFNRHLDEDQRIMLDVCRRGAYLQYPHQSIEYRALRLASKLAGLLDIPAAPIFEIKEKMLTRAKDMLNEDTRAYMIANGAKEIQAARINLEVDLGILDFIENFDWQSLGVNDNG